MPISKNTSVSVTPTGTLTPRHTEQHVSAAEQIFSFNVGAGAPVKVQIPAAVAGLLEDAKWDKSADVLRVRDVVRVCEWVYLECGYTYAFPLLVFFSLGGIFYFDGSSLLRFLRSGC